MTFRYDPVTLGRMTNQKRGSSAYHSFSNGNGPGQDEDQWSGNPLRTVHWWHWA